MVYLTNTEHKYLNNICTNYKYGVKSMLENYLDLKKWNCIGNELVLDVGCGRGDITKEILLSTLPAGVKSLTGVDISGDVIKNARKHNAHEKIDYLVLDIASKEVSGALQGKFDHLISTYCMHWVKDQRIAYQNMFNMLKPGGDILVSYVKSSPIFDDYAKLCATPKWSSYIKDSNKYSLPFQNCMDTETVLKDMLMEIGFDVTMCKVEHITHAFEDVEEFKDFSVCINPYTKCVPAELREEFQEEIIKLHPSTRFPNGKDCIHFETSIIVVSAIRA